ncbi:hypothetical protein IU470_18715 [Nocardia abscessus]|uniref:Uncharacterized protein n=1 Tax=Nocardia abscessus TaxID=120957 RepID=A0ABS0C9W1_9NOCA|nr:hypothetical protein [Nocardia abscessus]MBF6227130.1 hypothetical protein [Nocardia abscessus]
MKIAEFLARNAKLSGGAMKWNEEAKIKASMMNEPTRWVSDRVSPQAFESACHEAGLPADDAATVGEFLRKVHGGGRLVPNSQYRNFQFAIPFEPVS